ncbi:MAG: hypothetical protein ABR573_09830 [Candidatus Dormibacteria bacterium]
MNVAELAISPGLATIRDAGGMAAFTGWDGLLLQVTRFADAGTAAQSRSGWRARALPELLRREADVARVRSPLDGSIKELDLAELEGEAGALGGQLPARALPPGEALTWWDSRDNPVPSTGWVVSAVPATAGRAGFYCTGFGWAAVANIRDPATPGPLSTGCECRACAQAGIGYIAHLWGQHEITAAHLLGWHNLHVARSLVEG